MQKRHILITGERGIGKSTLVNKLLETCGVPIYGYRTKNVVCDSDGQRRVYIYPVSDNVQYNTEENCVAAARENNGSRGMASYPQVFDRLGVEYLSQRKENGLIVMDELGFLETDASVFCQKVLECLDGDIPVLAVVRLHKDTWFLNRVRSHPNAELYTVTLENRDVLYDVLKKIVFHSENTKSLQQFIGFTDKKSDNL